LRYIGYYKIVSNVAVAAKLNSFRQLTACLAIALVSTLSSHYTTQAIDNTKIRIIETVNSNTVLEQQIKSTICNKIRTAETSKNTAFTRDMVDKLMNAQEKTVLATVPNNLNPSVKEKFKVQAKEVYNIIDEATVIKNRKLY
jgi:hypothetical protein